MPPVPSALDDSAVIDISHESLMRVWRRLRGWVEEEAQSARIYRRLHETAALHAEQRAGLYTIPICRLPAPGGGERPNAAWADQYGGGFAEAMAFLDTSREAASAREGTRGRPAATSWSAPGNSPRRRRGLPACSSASSAAWRWPCASPWRCRSGRSRLWQEATRQEQEAKQQKAVANDLRQIAQEKQEKAKALGLVQRVCECVHAQGAGYYRRKWPGIVIWSDPLLRKEYESSGKVFKEAPCQPGPAACGPRPGRYLYGRLLEADAQELPVIRGRPGPPQGWVADRLWAVAEKPEKGKDRQRLRAAAALSKYDPDKQRWANVQGAVVNDLLAVPATQLGILADYVADQPQVLADLLMNADDKQFAVIYRS